MKKIGLLFVSFLLFGALMSGCEEIKDATDITFNITKNEDFTLDAANLTTVSSDVDLNENPDYAKYSGKIRDIEINYLRYQITSNTGGGGTANFYANTYGGSFATATKVAGPINFAACELRGVTDVVWINKDYLEGLLVNGRLTVWAEAAGTNVHLTIPAEINVKVTANVLE